MITVLSLKHNHGLKLTPMCNYWLLLKEKKKHEGLVKRLAKHSSRPWVNTPYKATIHKRKAKNRHICKRLFLLMLKIKTNIYFFLILNMLSNHKSVWVWENVFSTWSLKKIYIYIHIVMNIDCWFLEWHVIQKSAWKKLDKEKKKKSTKLVWHVKASIKALISQIC